MLRLLRTHKKLFIGAAMGLTAMIATATIIFTVPKKANASTEVSSETATKVKNVIEKASKDKFGEVDIKGNFDSKATGNDIRIVAKDDKYEYKVQPTSGKIRTIVANDPNSFEPEGDLSKDQAIEKAWDYLNQYAPVSDNCKYSLDSCEEISNFGPSSHYEVNFIECAKNGIRTGRNISIDINKLGDMSGLAQHEGNAEVAENTVPKLSQEDALKIVSDIVKKERPDLEKLPDPTVYLSVWNDKLAWFVKVETGEAITFYGREFYIDAVTGDIIADWS